MTETDELLTLPELAAELKVLPVTLYSWRKRRRGPHAFRVGGTLRYRRSIVNAWLAEQGDIRTPEGMA